MAPSSIAVRLRAGTRLGLFALVALRAGAARGEPSSPAPRPPIADPSTLDGTYLWLGPIGAATYVDTWDSAWGASLQLIEIEEAAPIAALGLSLGGVHYAGRDGGRVWVEGLIGTRRLGGRLIGVAAGPSLEIGDLHHPRIGVQSTFWCFLGVVPYLRAGVFETSKSFLEVGATISLPAIRF